MNSICSDVGNSKQPSEVLKVLVGMAKSLNDDILSCGSTDSSWMENIVLAPEDMAIILKSLDNNKVHSPDQIPARLLTKIATQIAPSLYII